MTNAGDMGPALRGTAPGGPELPWSGGSGGQARGGCRGWAAKGLRHICPLQPPRLSLLSGPGGIRLTARGSFPCNDLM